MQALSGQKPHFLSRMAARLEAVPFQNPAKVFFNLEDAKSIFKNHPVLAFESGKE
jgi:hypothetical protein